MDGNVTKKEKGMREIKKKKRLDKKMKVVIMISESFETRPVKGVGQM
jgi:hypothetical protein